MLSGMAFVGLRRGTELRRLVALCRVLAESGLDIGMCDARPALSVRAGPSHPRLWITVDATGEFFEWCRGVDDRHPVDDAAGAAKRIADRVTLRGRSSGP